MLDKSEFLRIMKVWGLKRTPLEHIIIWMKCTSRTQMDNIRLLAAMSDLRNVNEFCTSNSLNNPSNIHEFCRRCKIGSLGGSAKEALASAKESTNLQCERLSLSDFLNLKRESG